LPFLLQLTYSKLPPGIGPDTPAVLLLDPMLATGGSAELAINQLLNLGVHEDRIVFVNVVACPEGIERLRKS
jgi:uracil phosphoribosyltransferase